MTFNMILRAVAALTLTAAVSSAATIYTTPSSFTAATGGATLDPLSNFNASYLTPQTFALPADTTLVSFQVTAPPSSFGTPFSVWLNDMNDLGNRLYVFNIQDSLPTFIGIKNSTPMGSIILSTANSGYAFNISNFSAGPVAQPPVTSETPEPATMAMFGAGLLGVGLVKRARLLSWKAKRRLAQIGGPKREHVDTMRRVLDQMDGRERLVLLRYYVDGQTEEQICAEYNVTPDWFRAVKMEARARFASATRKPVQGSLGDLISAA